jgi:hypothetical protein
VEAAEDNLAEGHGDDQEEGVPAIVRAAHSSKA